MKLTSAGKSSRTKAGLGCLAFIVLFIVGMVLEQRYSSHVDELRRQQGFGPANQASPRKTKSDEPSLTMEKYNQVRTGMDYEDVGDPLGIHGEEVSRSEIAGITTVMYHWNTRSGPSMNAIFQNGKLVSKAQFR